MKKKGSNTSHCKEKKIRIVAEKNKNHYIIPPKKRTVARKYRVRDCARILYQLAKKCDVRINDKIDKWANQRNFLRKMLGDYYPDEKEWKDIDRHEFMRKLLSSYAKNMSHLQSIELDPGKSGVAFFAEESLKSICNKYQLKDTFLTEFPKAMQRAYGTTAKIEGND